MIMYKVFLKASVVCSVLLCACDLQPKIASIPDNIGMFISDRYPALLADPATQPEIYNSAVTDYGVYASPELYGSASINDYVVYASVDDYVLTPEKQETQQTKITTQVEQEIADDYLIVPLYGSPDIMPDKQTVKNDTAQTSDEIIVVRGDTVYSLARKNNMTVAEFAKINDLHEPYNLSVGQKLVTKRSAQKQEMPNLISVDKVEEIKQTAVKENAKTNNTVRVDLQEITIVAGDTLYSLSRKYEIPVNDLAVMNKMSAPFTLSVGQKIKVPKIDGAKMRAASQTKIASVKTSVSEKQVQNTASAPKQKISSDPKKQLPKITARSSSKFSWPVRGKILSSYGAKNNGLFNDGINISASLGTSVKAAENGVVAYAGNEVKGMGNLIIVQHSDGWMTIYAHLDSMSVKRGTRVNVGTIIGRVGKTGKVDKPQLHFEIRKGTKAYNPTQYLKK